VLRILLACSFPAPGCTLVVAGERLKQLDQVAGRVLQECLADAYAGDYLVAEPGAAGSKFVDGCGEVGDLDHDAVPR
jgi:hypothetical protein